MRAEAGYGHQITDPGTVRACSTHCCGSGRVFGINSRQLVQACRPDLRHTRRISKRQHVKVLRTDLFKGTGMGKAALQACSSSGGKSSRMMCGSSDGIKTDKQRIRRKKKNVAQKPIAMPRPRPWQQPRRKRRWQKPTLSSKRENIPFHSSGQN